MEEKLLDMLRKKGLNHRWGVHTTIPSLFEFEPPANVQWASLHGMIRVGAFSYFVNGFINNTVVGRYCSFGEAVQIGRGDHPTDWLSTSPFQYDTAYNKNMLTSNFSQRLTEVNTMAFNKKYQGTQPDTVCIGNDVWVGHGAFIKAGVTIGDGAIVGAGSVVVKNIPPYAIVGGVSAHIIRYRYSDYVIEKLLDLKWWRYPFWEFKEMNFSNVEDCIDKIKERIESGQLVEFPSQYLSANTLSEECV